MALNYPGNVTLSKRCIEPVGVKSSVRYLGIEVNDALEMAEQTEV
jgi:hypothetical protein